MTKQSQLSRLIPLVCITLLATTLVGCDEKYVGSRQEAESYATNHPNIPTNKIFIQGISGQDVTLEDLREQDRNTKQAPISEPPSKVATPTTDDQDGEVLKYEDPATSTARTIVELFSVTSIMAVHNNGTSPTIKLDKQTHLTELTNYHWNDGKGKKPGIISIKDKNGKTYGPWQATSALGQGGVPNAYWIITPNIDLPPGSYTVIDSDPATWSQNKETNGQGMLWAKGWTE